MTVSYPRRAPVSPPSPGLRRLRRKLELPPGCAPRTGCQDARGRSRPPAFPGFDPAQPSCCSFSLRPLRGRSGRTPAAAPGEGGAARSQPCRVVPISPRGRPSLTPRGDCAPARLARPRDRSTPAPPARRIPEPAPTPGSSRGSDTSGESRPQSVTSRRASSTQLGGMRF